MGNSFLIAFLVCSLSAASPFSFSSPVVLEDLSVLKHQECKSIKAHVSRMVPFVSDFAGVVKMNGHGAVGIMLDFRVPGGTEFVANGVPWIEVTDATGRLRRVEWSYMVVRIPEGEDLGYCLLRMERIPVFPLKLAGALKTKDIGGGILPLQEFEVGQGTQFKVSGMKVEVKNMERDGHGDGLLELEFNDVLDVRDVQLFDEKADALYTGKSSKIRGRSSVCTYTYRVKNMSSIMYASLIVNKDIKDSVFPVEITVDLNLREGLFPCWKWWPIRGC